MKTQKSTQNKDQDDNVSLSKLIEAQSFSDS